MSREVAADLAASREAIQRHYDVGNDFFQLWLDPEMTYSCALWEEGDTLAQAQLRKLDYHAAGARAAGQKRVLDVGCGWGAMLRRLVTHHRVERAVGLTLSAAQVEWIRAHSGPGVEPILQRWGDHRPDEPYDAIVSMGAFEHFAPFGLRVKERLVAYRGYFQHCHQFLRPGGWMTLQTIIRGNTPMDRESAHNMEFIHEEVYPESDMPRFAEVVEASERTFEISSARNDPEHYVRTFRAWREKLQTHREEATRRVGEVEYLRHEKNLVALEREFQVGTLNLLRVVMRRV